MRLKAATRRASLSAVLGIALALALIPPVKADYNLGFSSLPTAQGWQYHTAGNRDHTPESDIYSLSGNALHEDTLAQAVGSGGFAYYLAYFTPGTSFNVDPTRPFDLTVEARVTQDGGRGGTFPYGFGFGLILDDKEYQVGLSSADYAVTDAAGPLDILGSHDNTDWQTYTIAGSTDGKFDLLINGTTVQSDITPYTIAPGSDSSQFFLGDLTGYSNVVADDRRFTLTQPAAVSVPEPSPCSFLVPGFLIFVLLRSCRRRSRKNPRLACFPVCLPEN